jgi:hypothetical protein
MGRRGHSTSIGKFAKLHQDQRRSEIRVLGEVLRHERMPATRASLDAKASTSASVGQPHTDGQ